MKMIHAVIKAHCLRNVWESLQELDIKGMTVFEAAGYGKERRKPRSIVGRAVAAVVGNSFSNPIPRVRIEVAVTDKMAQNAIAAIEHAARENMIGNGLVWMTDILYAVRIRTGETGDDAIV